MENINLLPESLKIKGSVLGLTKKLRKLSVVVFAVLLAVVSISLGTFFFFRGELNESVSSQNELKTQIKALEETEQKLVLVKDRLKKIGEVYAKETSYEEVTTLEELIKKIPEGVSVQNAALLPGSMVVNLLADSTSSLERAIEMLVGSGLFEQVEVSSIAYTPEDGFVIGLLLDRK